MSVRTPPIGSLRDRVQLATKVTTAENEGGHSTAYMPLATVWARVTSLSGRLGTHAGSRAANASHTVVLRYRDDISPGDRITWRGRQMEVLSAEDLNGRRAYLSCACRETSFTG